MSGKGRVAAWWEKLTFQNRVDLLRECFPVKHSSIADFATHAWDRLPGHFQEFVLVTTKELRYLYSLLRKRREKSDTANAIYRRVAPMKIRADNPPPTPDEEE